MVVPLILSLVIGFGFLLAFTTDESSTIFSEEMRKSTVELSHQAEIYRNALIGVGSVDRVAFDEVTDQMLGALEKAQTVLAAAPADPSYSVPVAMLEETLGLWHQGVTAVRTQLFAAADDPSLSAPAVRILNALIDVKSGDRLYRSFVEAMGESAVTQPVSPFPTIELAPVQIDLALLSQAAANAATNPEGRLRLRADLMFSQIITVPKMVRNVDDEWVIPATDSLVVKAVVSNNGNTVTQPMEITMILLKGGEQVAELKATVPPVAAGQQTTAVFEAVTVEPGALYGLIVDLPLAEGEERADDNRRTIDFSVNLPATTTTTES